MSAGSIIAIGCGIWMMVIGLVLSLVRVAGRAEPDAGPGLGVAVGARPRAVASVEVLSHERTLGGRLRALALEDPSAGRHAAAVARNALALAQEAGLPEPDQEVAHAAGLLHDIGTETALRSIPAAQRELRRSDHRMIRRHPVDGARLVRDVPGLESVADAVLSHHERLDGNGYPFGLRDRSIPPAARVVAVAEVYDVLTAPDSYRRPLTTDQALTEMRASAGTQLDGRLVEIFATTVAGGGASRREADLETELRRLTGEL